MNYIVKGVLIYLALSELNSGWRLTSALDVNIHIST